MPFFKHFGMVTLPDASVDVEDERQSAAQMPYPARQYPVSSWEAVGELVHRHLCDSQASHHQGDGTREPRHSSPARPAPSTPAPQLGHRWASAARASRAEEVAADRLFPSARHGAPSCRGISRLFVGLRPGAAGSPAVRGAAAPPAGGGGKGWGGARGDVRGGTGTAARTGKRRRFPQEPWVKRLRVHTPPVPCLGGLEPSHLPLGHGPAGAPHPRTGARSTGGSQQSTGVSGLPSSLLRKGKATRPLACLQIVNFKAQIPHNNAWAQRWVRGRLLLGHELQRVSGGTARPLLSALPVLMRPRRGSPGSRA